MAELDLDGFRAARLEAEDDGEKVIVFGGERFELPREVPWDSAWEFAQGRNADGIRELMGTEPAARFFALGPSVNDIEALLTHLDEVYPDSSGKGSGASQQQSKRTSKPSKPTSNASTEST